MTQDKIITVRPHPVNPDGWAVFEGEYPAQLLNNNFFLEKENAELVARARRHVTMQRMLRKLTGMDALPSLKTDI